MNIEVTRLREENCYIRFLACDPRGWNGTAFGGAKTNTLVPEIVAWHVNGEIYTDGVITPKLSFDAINRGLDLMHAERSIRSALAFQVFPASRFAQRMPSPLQKDVKIS